MKKGILLFSALYLITAVVLAQNTETRKIDNFSAVDVGEAIKLILIPSNSNEAKITVSNIDLDDISTEVSGNKLRIELKGNRYKNIDVEIELKYKSISNLVISSAANVTTEGLLKANTLDLRVSSAGSARLEIEANELDLDVNSSGDLELNGKARSQRVDISSAGDYDGYDLLSESAYVRASSAGSARVNVSKEIDAKASSAGSIKYKGNPEKVSLSSSSGGSTSNSN
jgi:hypothetical protein